MCIGNCSIRQKRLALFSFFSFPLRRWGTPKYLLSHSCLKSVAPSMPGLVFVDFQHVGKESWEKRTTKRQSLYHPSDKRVTSRARKLLVKRTVKRTAVAPMGPF